MNKFAVVSFCNNPSASTSPLLCIKISENKILSNEYVPVNIGFPGTSTHTTGLTSSDRFIFIAFHSEGMFYIAALAKNDLSPVFYQPLPETKDIHSLLAWGKMLYVVSTGTDQVMSYDILENSLANPTVIWQPSKENKDTHHINSIILRDNELFISAFGPKTEQLWASAKNGYIHNITKDKRVKEGIYHPHSLSINNGELYYCESHKGSFCSLDGELFTLPGYTRGVSWLSVNEICIATSIGRKVSRSTGLVGNPGDPGEAHGLCGLTVRNIDHDENISSLDLSWFGPETYDVLFLDGQTINMQDIAVRSYISERDIVNEKQQKVESLSLQLKNEHAQLAERDARLAERDRLLHEIRSSKSWKIAMIIRGLRMWIMPPNSYQAAVGRFLFRILRTFKQRLFR